MTRIFQKKSDESERKKLCKMALWVKITRIIAENKGKQCILPAYIEARKK